MVMGRFKCDKEAVKGSKGDTGAVNRRQRGGKRQLKGDRNISFKR